MKLFIGILRNFRFILLLIATVSAVFQEKYLLCICGILFMIFLTLDEIHETIKTGFGVK